MMFVGDPGSTCFVRKLAELAAIELGSHVVYSRFQGQAKFLRNRGVAVDTVSEPMDQPCIYFYVYMQVLSALF